MARIFAYILHKSGVADDSAARADCSGEERSMPSGSPTAIVTGRGADLDTVCTALRASYSEVWKIANDALAHPNAELVRKALVKVLPHGQHCAGSACTFRS